MVTLTNSEAKAEAMKKRVGEISSHYKILAAWESEFSKGTMATQAPMIYANEKLMDSLALLQGEGDRMTHCGGRACG